jgi:hypothetical protein
LGVIIRLTEEAVTTVFEKVTGQNITNLTNVLVGGFKNSIRIADFDFND